MDLTSGLTSQYVPFVAVDATDLKTREVGLSGFTVYRSRNGGTLTAYTTPTIIELSSSNAPGVYALLVDEDSTITSGANEESYFLQIAHASMAPVSLNCVLKRPIVTAGQTLTVANGCADADIERVTGNAVPATSSNGVLKVDVTHMGGTAGTFASGRPEVNTTHAAGTAWGSGAITAGSIATGAFTAAKFAANALDAVWSTATRLLTAGTNIVLAKGTGVTGFNDLSAAQVNAEADTALSDVGLTTTITGRIDAAMSTRLASASYTAPDNASIAAILIDTAEIGAAGAGLTALASASALATVDGVVDAIKVTTDKLDDTLEDDSGTYRFTANALEEAPSGGGGGGPTADEIRDAVFARVYAASAGGYTFDELTSLIAYATLGKVSGMNTLNPVFRNLADSADAITATTDANGNRTAVTLTP